MAEETAAADSKTKSSSPDELALELMKFISVSTGYGKGTPTAGFGGKAPRSAEEHAEALLELFNRCRSIVRNDPK
jgi:ATP:corrinoid adenosyltransferase